MSDFWSNVTGTEKDAFGASFALIPDGTVATAEITNASLKKGQDGVEQYEFSWVLLDGEFAKRKVWQKVRCFDSNQDRATKAKNMLMLLYKLTQVQVPAGAPTDYDLSLFQGKMLKITIREWHLNGRDGNFVAEVHSMDSNLQSTVVIESAFSRNAAVQTLANDDLPF